MIKSSNKFSKDFAIVSGDWVNAKYSEQGPALGSGPPSFSAGSRGRFAAKRTKGIKSYNVVMTFVPYIDLYRALVNGLNEIEVTITERDRFTLDYFPSDKTPARVAHNINSFFTKAKQSLYNEKSRQAIHSETFNLTDFLPDSVVSQIGNHRINKKNYRNYYPKKSVIQVGNYDDAKASLENPIDAITTDRVHTGSLNETRDARDLAYDVFDLNGYDPAMIAQVAFPATSKEDRANGIRSNIINPKNYVIPLFNEDSTSGPPATFYELHKKFFKSTASEITRYSLIEKIVKLQYQPVKLRLRFKSDQANFQKLSLSKKLWLMITYKKNGVAVKTERFSFDSQSEFKRSNSVYRSLDLKCKAGDPSIAEGDKLSLRNPNPFPMRYEIIETSIIRGNISSKKIKAGLIRGKSIIKFSEITTFFGSTSQSRSYRVISQKPKGTALANIDEIVTPSSTQRPNYDSLFPAIYATKSSGNSAVVNVKNAPADTDLIKIFRKDLGPGRQTSGRYFLAGNTSVGKCIPEGVSRNILVAVMKEPSAFTDFRQLFHNRVYEYSVEFYSNGAKLPVSVSTILHYMDNSPVSRFIEFNISEKQSQKVSNAMVHSFKIEETVSKSAAGKLLNVVNSEAMQSSFTQELNELKTQTGMITSYKVVRANLRNGDTEIVATDAAPNVLQNYTVSTNLRDSYKYLVTLSAAPAGGASFSTSVEAIDTSSGQAYKYSYRKWRGQETLDQESLPSVYTVNKNNVKSSMGKSGKMTSVVFSAPYTMPKIETFNVTRDSFNKCNWVEWSLRGSQQDIDHFLILAFYNGVQAPIGAASVKGEKNKNFVYRDQRMFGLLGEVVYQIIIVTKDFTYYTNTPEKSVKYMSTVPPVTFSSTRG